MARLTQSDEVLAHQFKATSDPALLSELILRHQANVVRRCCTYVKDHDTAQDLSQEVFLRVHINIHRFEEGTLFVAWLYTIVRNRCVDHLRRDKTALIQQLSERIMDSLTEELESEEEPLPTTDELLELIEQLGGKDKFLLLAKYQENWSIKELEQVTGLSASTIKTRLHRIKARLRKSRRSV